MLVEASLPKVAFEACPGAQRVRVATFDALNASLQGLIRGWRDQQVKVVRHNHEGMQGEPFFVTVVEERLTEKQRILSHLKNALAIGCDDGDEEGLQDRPHVARLGDAAGFR